MRKIIQKSITDYIAIVIYQILRQNPASDVSSVSGFYGPGAYMSWCLTTASMLLHTCQKAAAMAEDGSQADSEKKARNGIPWVINPELVLSCAYAVIAAVDRLSQSVKHNEGPLAACMFVIGHSGDFNAHAMLLCSRLPFLEETQVSTMFQPISMLVAIAGLTGTLAPAFEAGFSQAFKAAIEKQRHKVDIKTIWYPLLYVGLPLGLSVIARYKRNTRNGLKLYERIYFLLGFMSLKFTMNFFMIRGSAVPMTTTSISDLDQAAALGTTTIILAYTWRGEAAHFQNRLLWLMRHFIELTRVCFRERFMRTSSAHEAQPSHDRPINGSSSQVM